MVNISFLMLRCTKSGRLALEAEPSDGNTGAVSARSVNLLFVRVLTCRLSDVWKSLTMKMDCVNFWTLTVLVRLMCQSCRFVWISNFGFWAEELHFEVSTSKRLQVLAGWQNLKTSAIPPRQRCNAYLPVPSWSDY